MWRIRYYNSGGQQEEGYFSVCDSTSEEDGMYYQPNLEETFAWRMPDEFGLEHKPKSLENSEAVSWVKLPDKQQGNLASLPQTTILPVMNGELAASGLSSSFDERQSLPAPNAIALPTATGLDYKQNGIPGTKHVGPFPTPVPMPVEYLYGNHSQIFWACVVRFFMICHNVMTVWRVVEAYDEKLYWLMAVANLVLLLELHVVIVKKAGSDYSWWTPSFLIYLLSTVPAIWLLQLELHYDFIKDTSTASLVTSVPTTAARLMTSTVTSPPITTSASPSSIQPLLNITDSSNGTTINGTMFSNMTTNSTLTSLITPTSLAPLQDAANKIVLDNSLWIIIVQESLVYLLVFCRWLLPRGNVSRAFLADLLLEFLAIASDIMELLVVFEFDEIRGDLALTYAILGVWSASFIQFIPVLMHKRRFRHVRNPRMKCITRVFGDKFVEIVVTLMSICLQDMPFLVVRLYVIIQVQIINYSLIFFVLKNIVTLMLLFYRLFIIGRHLPVVRRCLGHKSADEKE